jgi:hypothetical protein
LTYLLVGVYFLLDGCGADHEYVGVQVLRTV